MPNSEVIRTFSSASFTFRAVRPAFAAVMAVMMICTGSQLARALPAYAKRTGLPCRQCHVNPAGGGTLKPFGRRFQANGHRLSKSDRARPNRQGYGQGTQDYGPDDDGPGMMQGSGPPYGQDMMGPGMMGPRGNGN